MKCDIPTPLEKLISFQGKVGLQDRDLRKLDQYKRLFVEKKEEFARFLYDYFFNIPEARILLSHEKRQGLLKKAWSKE